MDEYEELRKENLLVKKLRLGYIDIKSFKDRM